ncbi:hypothetical protein ACWGPW_24230 [Paenibacillus chitinolyticus]
MLKWFFKLLLNLVCLSGAIAALVYILSHGGKLDKQMIDAQYNRPAPKIVTVQEEDSDMTDYMYNVWLPVTTTVILN